MEGWLKCEISPLVKYRQNQMLFNSRVSDQYSQDIADDKTYVLSL